MDQLNKESDENWFTTNIDKTTVSQTRQMEMTEAEKIKGEMMRRRWKWIGHVLRKDPTDDCAVFLLLTPARRRKRGA